MALTIAIEEFDNERKKVAYVTLPANKIGVIDAMDKAKIFGKTSLRISRCDEVSEIVNFKFKEEPTLDELNFLAMRIDEICKDEAQKLAYGALLRKPFDTINEVINRTYNIETVGIYPCESAFEYGKMVIENDLLEELKDVSDEVLKLLDPEKVGRAKAEREGGYFVGDYYIVTDCYEPVLVYVDELPEPMEDWVFKLEIAGVPEKAEDFSRMKTETLTLPVDEETMQDIAEAVGERNIDECISMKFESAIPQIDNDMWSMEEIYLLNDIARDFLELSREDAAKFKAVLESEQPQSLDKIESTMKYLDNYEFDYTLDRKAYAEEFNARILPPNLNKNVFSITCTDEFGDMILAENHCKYTDYGIISEHGGRLFPADGAPQQEQNSDLNMGGIS